MHPSYKDIAITCARFIHVLLACPRTPAVLPSVPTDIPIPPPLSHFIHYGLRRTRLHPSVALTALFFLQRLKGRTRSDRTLEDYRLFISAYMLASKVMCDTTYSNKSWVIVGQNIFSLNEINQMERDMCRDMEWKLNVDPLELFLFGLKIQEDFGSHGWSVSTTSLALSTFYHSPLPSDHTLYHSIPISLSTNPSQDATMTGSQGIADSQLLSPVDFRRELLAFVEPIWW